MNVLDSIRGYRSFKTSEEIVNYSKQTFQLFDFADYYNKNQGRLSKMSQSEFYKEKHGYEDHRIHSIDKATSFNFFETNYQKSWLICLSSSRDKSISDVFCILDDIRKKTPEIKWRMSIELFKALIDNNKIVVRESKIDGFGLIDFGEYHKKWYYSEGKFNNSSIILELAKWIKVD